MAKIEITREILAEGIADIETAAERAAFLRRYRIDHTRPYTIRASLEKDTFIVEQEDRHMIPEEAGVLDAVELEESKKLEE